MNIDRICGHNATLSAATLVLLLAPLACAGDDREDARNDNSSTTASTPDDEDDEEEEEDGSEEGEDEGGNCPPGGCLDLGSDDEGMGPDCGDESCAKIDLLFVIDNSGTMGEEQKNLARNFALLVDKLENLKDSTGALVHPDVQIMVTTTDLGHPVCTPFQPEGYSPQGGTPVASSCNSRLGDFTGISLSEEDTPPSFPEACTDVCPADVMPSEPVIRFDRTGNNVLGGSVAEALSCIGPQGINGCGYEGTLESMLQALNPDATWNTGDNPFIRDDATLAIVVVTDEADCSVASPDGFKFFTDPTVTDFWAPNPDEDGVPTQPTSAVCWNGGVECGDADGDGVYADCMSVDNGVLHPVSRYINHLKGAYSENKDVVMLGILGVPLVTEHNANAPFQPTAGGVFDLVYRQWQDADILPGEGSTPAQKEWEFGVGPGCTGQDEEGNYTGQAVPPVRIKEVCESLNGEEEDEVRCCIESICDTDFSAAINCLTGIIQETIIVG